MPFRSMQFRFAAHLRDPVQHPAPRGLDERRLKVYRDLFFSNVHGFLSSAFPVLRKTLGAASFRKLVRGWYSSHRAQTPLFPRMPGEFATWLAGEPAEASSFPAWVPELAHYEWVETELDLAEAEVDVPGAARDGDLLTGIPVLSPLARPLSYRWPVHRIGPGAKPDEPGPHATTLLVYRDRADKVRFMETNLVTHQLVLAIADDGERSGAELLDAIAKALPHADPDALRRAGAKTLERLRDAEVIAGVRA